jgi:hypothetical protein
MHNWVVIVLPIALAIARAINWPTAIVLAAVLGLVSSLVGWVVAVVVFMPMAAILLIRARSRRDRHLATGSRSAHDA